MNPGPPGGTAPTPTGTRTSSGEGTPPVAAAAEDERIRRILSVTGGLPPLPPVATRLLELVRSETTSVGDLERAIAPDGALAARIVAMANSAFYAFDQKVSTLSHAIVILGFRAVPSMALAAAVRSLCLPNGARSGRGERRLWEHSLGCALAARQIARLVRFEREETAFLAGLLHDVGKAILHRILPGSPADAERGKLGFDHAQIGALVARHWNLSPELVEAIAAHHDPDLPARGGSLAAILAVADDVAKRTGIAPVTPGAPPLADGWGARALSLGPEALDPIPGIVNGVLDEEGGP